ncbi:hypothetical protein D3C83_105670 [compost metagenome]
MQSLEFDRVAAAVGDRHQHLLADRPFLRDRGLVEKLGALPFQPLGGLAKIVERHDHTEVT